MIIDTNPHSSGYAIHCTMKGSYGETTQARIGRAYDTLAKAVIKLAEVRRTHPDAVIVDPKGRLVMPEASKDPRILHLAGLW